MKIIAISQRVQKIKKYKELRDQIDSRLIEFVIKSGFFPIPIPNFKKKNKADLISLIKWLNLINPSGIVLSGGDDIGKFKYRDQNELNMIDWSIKKKIPIFGICRGMQIIGHWAKVKLKKINNHVSRRHLIIPEVSKYPERYVNSFHNLALSRCPKNFKIVYKSKDGAIESIENKKKKIFGCMWHPEREKKFNKKDISNFKFFFNQNK